MLPAIPQELSDMILDFLHDDKRALWSAGLVCKSWLPTSRFHIFSSVQLVSAFNPELWEVISAECSTIPPYILDLNIEGHKSQFVNEALLRFPLLSNLKTLSLFMINMAELAPDAKRRLTTLLQNLRGLCLMRCNFETVDQLVDFIASAPCLEDISLSRTGCSESSDYSSQAIAPPLRRIIFFELGPLVDNIMDWFCRCYPSPIVHTLQICQITTGDNIPTLCKFIRHLGSALEYLSISCDDSDESDQVHIALSERFDLSQNISLRNIFFRNKLLYADPLRPRPCGWIISVLSSIAHPSLENVVLYIEFVEEIDALELSTLDTLFMNQPLSSNSTKLSFIIWPVSVDREVVLAALKDGLPKLDGKKRLEIIFHPSTS